MSEVFSTIKHDVKPRVYPLRFSRGLAYACAQAKILPVSKAARKEHRLTARWPEFNAGKISGKNWSECPIYSKRRSRRLLSKSANSGRIKGCAQMHVGRAFQGMRQSLIPYQKTIGFRRDRGRGETHLLWSDPRPKDEQEEHTGDRIGRSEGPLFPRLQLMQEKHRAKEFRRCCLGLGIHGVTLHSYRYAWAERAKQCGYPSHPTPFRRDAPPAKHRKTLAWMGAGENKTRDQR
jgi:hypothetical protein